MGAEVAAAAAAGITSGLAKIAVAMAANEAASADLKARRQQPPAPAGAVLTPAGEQK